MMGIPRDHKTPYKRTDRCHECDEPFKKKETMKSGAVVQLEVYDDPWATEPCIVKLHADNDDGHGTCLDKLTDTGWADFRYFVCEKCQRTVVRQCLDNGWRSYVKHTESGEEICVRCYQEDMLENGVPIEAFERERIPGDFFGAQDISNAGYSVVPGYHGMFINGAPSVKALCTKAILLIKSGLKVIVDYESMGIGGGEGYVTLYAK